ncbi:MAG: thiamine-phosphate kinase [Steroidobacteraceae bacterium]|nr:thiamine-phosphate kinase [Steroidobacteraceae bacterium]
MALGEFDLIDRFFRRPSRRSDVLLGVGDDAALLEPPAGRALVAATDTLVEGRHFLHGAPGRSVGHQALAVNLSDLAAMGADPAWALLSLSLPEVREDWLEDFALGFHVLADTHGVELVGGDTVRGPLVVTVEVLGFVEPALALRRSGAQPGDVLFVSGSPGEAAAGLEMLRRGGSMDSDDPLVLRYLYAQPRLELGRALRGRASAAMDVSDGLLGDLGKLCAASGVCARIDLAELPVSDRLLAAHGREASERLVLLGGDDYELLFTLSAAEADRGQAELRRDFPITRIGEIEAGRGVLCERDGLVVQVAGGGYDHFA